MATWQPRDQWDPGTPESRERTRRLKREMRVHLLSWDPIGVADEPKAQGEYDSYISPLLHMLHAGESVDAITGYLTNLVVDRMGLRSHPEREREFAETLIDWWSRLTIE